MKKTRVLFPEGFKDGTLADAFAEAGHSSTIGVGEIVELPLDLLKKIEMSGGIYSTNPDEIQLAETQQAKHQQRERLWQERQEQAAADLKERQMKKALEHKLKTEAELKSLRERVQYLYGREEQITWNRINDLEASLK